jgi:transcriptional regulator with XRE-family HTH domain
MIEPDEFSEISTWLPLTLREARESRGLTQRKLAALANVGEKTISSFETGVRADRMKLLRILRIVKALDITIDKLLVQPVAEVRSLVVEPASAPVPKFKPGRGVTIFRSSDFPGSYLGEARR